MPQAYIDRAEAELLQRATDYLNENSSPRHTLTVTCDTLHLKRNDMNFEVGQLVHVTANEVKIDRDIRVVGYTRNIRQIYDYTLQLSDFVNPSRIDRIESDIDKNEKKIVVKSVRDRMYTTRSFKNVQDTIAIMYDPDGEYFTDLIQGSGSFLVPNLLIIL